RYTAPTKIYTLRLHDALPISLLNMYDIDILCYAVLRNMHCCIVHIQLIKCSHAKGQAKEKTIQFEIWTIFPGSKFLLPKRMASRSEEHTSELQSRGSIVCRLL